MKNKRILLEVLILFLPLTFIACTAMQSPTPAQRRTASDDMHIYDSFEGEPQKNLMDILNHDAKTYGGRVEFTKPLDDSESMKLWHLSEGSDIFPMAWFLRLSSQFSHEPIGSTKLNEALDKKFGVIKEPTYYAEKSPYPMKWIGLSSSWSNASHRDSDVRLKPGQSIEDALGVKKLADGKESIAMIGVNCAFCHSGVVTLNDKQFFIDGNPALLNIRGFFQDIFGSTAKTMLTPELLEKFLEGSKVKGDHKKIAKDFSKRLTADLKLDGISALISKWNEKTLNLDVIANKKKAKIKKHLYENREIMAKYLTELLQITYGLKNVSEELKTRMAFLATSMGVDPDLAATQEGFARTDAFGRISNLVARTKDPIPLTATASVPTMWNIQYKALFHWNANTNSVIMRNIGQSFGLGAVMVDQAKAETTSNLFNLHHLEELLHRVRAPVWTDIDSEFKETPENLARIVDGCNVYHSKCIGCHGGFDANANGPNNFMSQRVGPANLLIRSNVIPLKTIGTDETYTYNQSTPVDGVPFRTALFTFTGRVKKAYYEKYGITEAEQKYWEKVDWRGPELFRDTVLGETSYSGISEYLNIPANPTPGYTARHLASVWSTAPYLHNGSIPDIEELLKPAEERRQIFFVGSTRYDRNRLGFFSRGTDIPNLEERKERAREIYKKQNPLFTGLFADSKVKAKDMETALVMAACEMYPERCFDSTLKGNSNRGHSGEKFGTNLSPMNKKALIEFLKVLRPEVEYSTPSLKAYYKWDSAKNTCVKPN